MSEPNPDAVGLLISRWRQDPGGTYETWFLWDQRLKNFRSIRRGLAEVVSEIEAGTGLNDEINVAIVDRGVAARITGIFERDLDRTASSSPRSPHRCGLENRQRLRPGDPRPNPTYACSPGDADVREDPAVLSGVDSV